MLTIYKYFKEKTSSILKSVFIFLAWRQGLGALHLESRQLLKTCQSALWFIPWFFFPPLTSFPTASPLFLVLSLPSFSILAISLTFLFLSLQSSFLCLKTVLWQLFWGMWQLGSSCFKTSPHLSSPTELEKCVSNHLLSLGLEDNPGLALDLGCTPEGIGNRGGSLL